jgi:hypothetical protein
MVLLLVSVRELADRLYLLFLRCWWMLNRTHFEVELSQVVIFFKQQEGIFIPY